MEQFVEKPDRFISVTEVAGDSVTQEQIERLCAKYYWAQPYCQGKDIVEVGCGTGPGLGYLSKTAASVVGGDISESLLNIARAHYGRRVSLQTMDAQHLPFENQSKDTILLFEALYYLPEPERFFAECARVLRPGGVLLIVTANKDIYAFNPSPHSFQYFGVQELTERLRQHGFATRFFGSTPIAEVSAKQKLLQPIKKFAVQLNLIPKTMSGKKLLKRLVFGKLVPMPNEITEGTAAYDLPMPLPAAIADKSHKVIFCEARLRPSN